MEALKNLIQIPKDSQISQSSESEECDRGCFQGWLVGPKGAYRCKCLRDKIDLERYQALLRVSQVSDKKHMTFENYKPKHPKQQHALNAMFQEHGSFYLFGPFGTGKTHLNTASVFRAIQNRIQACMISVPALLKEMRVFGRDSSCSVERLAQRIPYLALDDIGKQKDSDWTDERLFELIDKRYTLWKDEKGHTSITSNLTLTDLSKRIDGATVDRIRGMCKQLFVDGESNR